MNVFQDLNKCSYFNEKFDFEMKEDFKDIILFDTITNPN